MNLKENINFFAQKHEKKFFYFFIFLIISFFIFWFFWTLKITNNFLSIQIILLINIFILIFWIIFIFFYKRKIFIKYNLYIIVFFLIFVFLNIMFSIITSNNNNKNNYTYLNFFFNLSTIIIFLTFYILKKKDTILKKISEKEKKFFCYSIITFVFCLSCFIIFNWFIKVETENQEIIIKNLKEIKKNSKTLYYLKKIELVLYPSVMEELLFRFFLCGLFVKKKNKIIVGTLLFSIMHCSGLFNFTTALNYFEKVIKHSTYFILSFFLCYVHVKTKKIRYNFFFHGLNNFLEVIFL